jgi:hypothetical protein
MAETFGQGDEKPFCLPRARRKMPLEARRYNAWRRM